MSKIDITAIRVAWPNKKRVAEETGTTITNSYELAYEHIHAALDALETEIDGIIADRDHWKARAEALENALRFMVEFAGGVVEPSAPSQWVSVADKMPPELLPVLMRGESDNENYNGYGVGWVWQGRIVSREVGNVTHWQLLPAPP